MTRTHQSLISKLEEHVRFQTLLAEISAQFVNLPADRIDNEIENALRRICELLNVDRSTLWQVCEGDPGTLLLTHLHQPPGSTPPPERMNTRDFAPWTGQKVLNKETVIISKLTDLPPEAALDRETFRLYGTKSNAIVPLSVGEGPVFGLLTFAAMREERSWPEPAVVGFKLIAQIFANALARKRAEETLRSSEQRYRTVADYAYDWEYWAAPDGRMRYISPACERITGYSSREFMDDPSLLRNIILPEDLGDWDNHDHYAQTKLTGDETIFRIRRKDGAIRWIGHGCRRVIDDSGECHGIRGSNRDITDRKELETSLRKSYDEIKGLKERLEAENIYLRREVYPENTYEQIIGRSDALRQVLRQVEQVAPADAVVLITGETGTGKELIGEAIHAFSKRKDRLLVKVNCASLPAALVESELFGREKGAYTGALAKQIGRFELADCSTLFLDEITELTPELQAKLLRVLQNGEFERLGSPKTIRADVRLIAATNRDIAAEVHRGAFRKDLYYRLNVFPIHLPSLRERPDDIPLLVDAFVREFSRKMDKKIQDVPQKTMDLLQRYHWPGNIRELRNVIEHAVIITSGNTLAVKIPEGLGGALSQAVTLEQVEYQHILGMLKATGWRIKGPRGAAVLLGMKPATLYARMRKLGIPTRTEKDRLST